MVIFKNTRWSCYPLRKIPTYREGKIYLSVAALQEAAVGQQADEVVRGRGAVLARPELPAQVVERVRLAGKVVHIEDGLCGKRERVRMRAPVRNGCATHTTVWASLPA